MQATPINSVLPVVIAVMPVPQPTIIATSSGMVLRSGHPHIPLTNDMSAVAGGLQMACYSRHIQRNALKTPEYIPRVHAFRIDILHVHVNRIPPSLDCTPCWRAELVGVESIQLDTRPACGLCCKAPTFKNSTLELSCGRTWPVHPGWAFERRHLLLDDDNLSSRPCHMLGNDISRRE